MANANDVVNLISVLQARAHALRTATDATYDSARERLRQAFVTARQYRDEGQGSIDSGTWSSFESTLRRALYTFNEEATRREAGTAPASGEVMVFTPEEVFGPTPTTRVATTTRARPRAAPRAPAAPAATPTAPPTTAPPTTISKGAAPGAPPTVPGAPGYPGTQPTTGFLNFINPADRPVYLRPWFIGLAATSTLALGYTLWSYLKAKPARSQPRRALSPHRGRA